jgi:hypothetical protein
MGLEKCNHDQPADGGRLRIEQTTDQLLGIVLHGVAPQIEAARRLARVK